MATAHDRVNKALEIAIEYGDFDGAHHKAWVIDQMVRALAAENYNEVIRAAKAGPDGPNTYGWDIGIAP